MFELHCTSVFKTQEIKNEFLKILMACILVLPKGQALFVFRVFFFCFSVKTRINLIDDLPLQEMAIYRGGGAAMGMPTEMVKKARTEEEEDDDEDDDGDDDE